MPAAAQRLAAAAALLWAVLATPTCCCKPNPTPAACDKFRGPVGGGAGYARIVSTTSESRVLSAGTSAAEFVNAVQNAEPGDVIFLERSLGLDLTGHSNIRVPAGVVIASDRGLNGSRGAEIRTNDFAVYNIDTGVWNDPGKLPLFEVVGDNVRFSGLRLIGPSPDIGAVTWTKQQVGIRAIGRAGLEIDNCELTAFPSAAVRVDNGSYDDNCVHHCHIHANRQRGYGYGVQVNAAYAVIATNLFHHNRHDIAGSGASGSGYEAAYNRVLRGGTSHNFDMHGGGGDKEVQAGRLIHIHHNVFEDDAVTNVKIRGRPEVQCRVENNRFAQSTVNKAVEQNRYHGNLLVINNLYEHRYYLGWYVSDRWQKKSSKNWFRTRSTNDLLHSSVGGAQVAYAFGDFDGDGQTDVFKSQDGRWYTIPLTVTAGLAADWTDIGASSQQVHELAFGYFDDDDTTDAFRGNGTHWLVSFGGRSSWQEINTSGFLVSDVVLGFFDADDRSDVFRANGVRWDVSFRGRGSWHQLNTSGEGQHELAFGDFNGDHVTDVLHGNGAVWKVSWSGVSSWEEVNTSGATATDITVGDVNGDGQSDVLGINGGRWSVSLSAVGAWRTLNTTNFPPATFPYGDL